MKVSENIYIGDAAGSTGTLTVSGIGTAQASGTVDIHAQITGTIDKIGFVEGQTVHTGDLIPHRERGGTCPNCGTPLERETVGGRTTYWCPRDQPG